MNKKTATVISLICGLIVLAALCALFIFLIGANGAAFNTQWKGLILDMKKTAVISLICGVIVLGVLCTVFALLMANGQAFNFGEILHVSYPDSNSYEVGNFTLSTNELKEIEIDWTAGSTNVEAYDGDLIEAYEDYDSGNRDMEMRYKFENGKLTIRFCRAKWWFGFFRTSNKNLTLKVPTSLAENLEEIRINTVSATTDIRGFSGNRLNLETVSGDIRAKDLNFARIDCDTVSGEITFSEVSAKDLIFEGVSGALRYSGELDSAKTEAVSGNIQITSTKTLSECKAETVSGSISLTLPEDSAFRVEYSRVSGSFSTDFVGTEKDKVFRTETETSSSPFGDYSFETVSGSMSVRKGDR